MAKDRDHAKEFNEWLTRGPGEPFLGGILKAAATHERLRLEKKLEIPNLFPHIEHEDKAALDKAKQTWERGDKMVKRGRARIETIKGILDADAGLRITDEDLKP